MIEHTEVRNAAVGTDPELSPEEKETTLTFPNDTETGYFYSEVPTMIKWFLSIEAAEVEDYRVIDDEIVAVTGRVPKGIVKLQATPRKSDTHSQMVSYGEQR